MRCCVEMSIGGERERSPQMTSSEFVRRIDTFQRLPIEKLSSRHSSSLSTSLSLSLSSILRRQQNRNGLSLRLYCDSPKGYESQYTAVRSKLSLGIHRLNSLARLYDDVQDNALQQNRGVSILIINDKTKNLHMRS